MIVVVGIMLAPKNCYRRSLKEESSEGMPVNIGGEGRLRFFRVGGGGENWGGGILDLDSLKKYFIRHLLNLNTKCLILSLQIGHAVLLLPYTIVEVCHCEKWVE